MNLYGALDVSASGLSAQRRRVEALAENIANSETTRTPAGGPYRRKRVVFETVEPGSVFGDAFRNARLRFDGEAAAGVRVARVSVDPSPPDRRYQPDHPDAGPDGYVLYPSFNPIEDMVDLTASVRSYQANLAVMEAVKQMINQTIEVAR